jgi:hypothetical protein
MAGKVILQSLAVHNQRSAEGCVEDQRELYVFASPEMEELLADNRTDLVELLQQEGVAVRRGSAPDPAADPTAGSKEPTTVILASAAVVAAITPLIIKVVERLTRKTALVVEKVPVALLDGNGQVVHDSSGKPIYRWVDRARVLTEQEQSPEERSVTIQGPLGIAIGIKQSPKDTNPQPLGPR